MAYYLYLGKMLCPVTPSKVETKINGKNKTMTLINEGEINIVKKAGLTDITFDLLFPNVKYPFAAYKSGFKDAKHFLDELENLKLDDSPFQFILTRTLPNGKFLFSTNIKVTLEDYAIREDKNEGFDVIASVKLKQWKNFGTKTCNIQFSDSKPKVSAQNIRPAETAPKVKTYTVKPGDCLWNIAKKYYDDGSKYTIIYNANKDKIKNPNLIYPDQVFVIPEV
jgi:hypothetical protein